MKPETPENLPPDEGRYAYEGLDRVIHERARLSVLTSLVTNPKGLTFAALKQMCSLTDGNLSRHLSVLEEAKLVEILKGTERNRPLTLCRITPAGRKRFLEYLATLEQVVRDAAIAKEAAAIAERAAASATKAAAPKAKQPAPKLSRLPSALPVR